MTIGTVSFGKRTGGGGGSDLPGVRAFPPSSPVNTPLVAGIPMQPLLWPTATGFNYFAILKDYIDIPNLATAPTCSFNTTFAPLGWPGGTQTRQMTHGFSGASFLSGGTDTDNEAISIIGNNAMSIWIFDRLTDTTAATAGAVGFVANIQTDSGFGIKGIQEAGVVASLSSNLVGLLLKEEWTKYGVFNHMLAFCGSAGLVNAGIPIFPAISNDGSSSNGNFTEGNILTFLPGTTMPAGGSVYMPALFAAIRDYGMVVVDNGGANQFYAGAYYDQTNSGGNLPFGASTSWTNTDIFGSLVPDANLLFPLLWKTGPPMDGFGSILGTTQFVCSPQVQFFGFATPTPLMTIKRDSDSTSSNVSASGVAGLLNQSSISSFCSGTTGRVTTNFNHFGAFNSFAPHNDFISSGANNPIIYQSGTVQNISSVPAMLFDGTSNYFKGSVAGVEDLYPGTAIYLNAVIQLTDLTSNYAIFGSDASGGLVLQVNATTGQIQLQTNTGTVIGTATASIVAGSPYLISATYVPGSSWSININGQGISGGSTAVSATASNILVGQAGPTSTSFFKGLISAWTVTQLMPSNPQYSIENALINLYGPMGSFTRIHNTVAQDGFVDTNGTNLASHTMTVGSGWTNLVGTHFIQSNSGTPNTLSSGTAIATFAPTTPSANGTYTCTLTSQASDAGDGYLTGMVFRLSNASNFMLLQVDANTNQINLYECIGGAFTKIASTSPGVSGTSYTIVISYYNSNISFTVNGGSPITAINSFNSTATGVGIRSGSFGIAPTKPVFNTLLLQT